MDDLALLIAVLGIFGSVTGVFGYMLGKEDGRIDERQRLYWRSRASDRSRM